MSSDASDEVAAKAFIDCIDAMNATMDIPETLPGILTEDIPQAGRATPNHEAQPALSGARCCGAPISWKKCTNKFRRFPPMTEMEIQTILKRQREYFAAGHTLPAEARIAALQKLKASLQRHEEGPGPLPEDRPGQVRHRKLYVRGPA